MGKKLEIKAGDKFGKWTVLEETEPYVYRCGNRNRTKRRVKVQCECGCQRTIVLSDLTRGKSRMCKSCSKTKHGALQHPLYRVIGHAIRRCYNTNDPSYKNYGGRGIEVCAQWRNDRGLFVSWGLRNGWEPGLELDREDNDGDYTPENCRFVSRSVNVNNRRNTLRTVDGVPVADIYNTANYRAVSYSCFSKRIEAGWDVSAALTTKSRKWRRSNG